MENIEELGIERTETKVVRILGLNMRIRKPIFHSKSRWTARNIVLLGIILCYFAVCIGALALLSDLYTVSVKFPTSTSMWEITIARILGSIYYIAAGLIGYIIASEIYKFNFKGGYDENTRFS